MLSESLQDPGSERLPRACCGHCSAENGLRQHDDVSEDSDHPMYHFAQSGSLFIGRSATLFAVRHAVVPGTGCFGHLPAFSAPQQAWASSQDVGGDSSSGL